MPKYIISALREQQVTVEFEAPNLEAAIAMCSDPTHQFDMSEGNAKLTVEKTLPEVYGVTPESLEEYSP